jgi:NAD(P)-dependent dehydrogenase (short-subunit alcohol dehydrogenase family)
MTYQPDLFKGKSALVTGGTTGIGAGIATELARHGARVVAVGIGAAQPVPDGLDIEVRELDVNDNEAVKETIESFDRLDFVVNCAGVIKRVEEHQIDVFEKVLATTLTGTMRVCTHAREKLKITQGAIVNTASMLSFFGGGLVPAYSASKGGVAQLTKSLAIAYAADLIRVNAIAPGWIATPLTQALQDDPVRAGPILDRTPMKRWGTPADVAAATIFLLSPAAAFMTGVVMPVDGGYLIACG